MNKFFFKPLMLAAIASFTITFTGCKDDEVIAPPDQNEEELITTVELTFQNSTDSNDVRIFKFADPDGDGGNAPTLFDTIKLEANSSYTLGVRFLDESKTPAEDITEEVREEADEHLVCYTSAGNITTTITDQDGNNQALGLRATVQTQEAQQTNFMVSLKHQPGVKNGSCNVGETDVEVDFTAVIR